MEYGHGAAARELQRTAVSAALPRAPPRVSEPLYRLGTHAACQFLPRQVLGLWSI